MNPQEYPLYRGLTFQLARPDGYLVLKRLAADDKLYTRLLSADIEAWPELKAAVVQATAMRASAEARRVIDGIV
jgi:hypothetical protein